MIETNTEELEINEFIFTEEDAAVIEVQVRENEQNEQEEIPENKKKENKYDPNMYGNAASQQDQEELFRELISQYQKRLYRFVIKYIDHHN